MILLPPVTRDVLPTPTVLTTVRVREQRRLAFEVTNNDGSQTLAVTVQQRLSTTGDFSDTTVPDLLDIPAGATRSVILDVAGLMDVRLSGVASGGGLTCRVAGTLLADS